MTVADWVILAITTVLVIVLGGMPEQITERLVNRIAVHRPLDKAKVIGATCSWTRSGHEFTDLQVDDIVQWFNQSIYLGRVSKVYLPEGRPSFLLELKNPNRTITVFPFRSEVGVLLKRRHSEAFYHVRSRELSRLLSQEAV